MTTLRGIAQPSDYLLTHMLLAYWRKLLVTVLLPNYKHRGTQVSYDAHSKWYPASRIGQSLEEGGTARADFTGVRASTTTH